MAHFLFCLLETAMSGALAALLTFQCLGEGVSYVFHIPVPAPAIGMLLLSGFVMLRPQTAVRDPLRRYAVRFWPGPATVALAPPL